jgi:O-antigen/teichoic acid export membrane protein
MVVWLSPLVTLRCLAMFPLNGLMGIGRTAIRTALLLGSAALSLTLYITLIPSLEWRGAALGTLIGEAALAVAAWWLIVRYQRQQDREENESPVLVGAAS